jgi:hypothetical protein
MAGYALISGKELLSVERQGGISGFGRIESSESQLLGRDETWPIERKWSTYSFATRFDGDRIAEFSQANEQVMDF